jgi:hypothetical protein
MHTLGLGGEHAEYVDKQQYFIVGREHIVAVRTSYSSSSPSTTYSALFPVDDLQQLVVARVPIARRCRPIAPTGRLRCPPTPSGRLAIA